MNFELQAAGPGGPSIIGRYATGASGCSQGTCNLKNDEYSQDCRGHIVMLWGGPDQRERNHRRRLKIR